MGHAHKKHVKLTMLKLELIRNGPCKKKDLIALLGMDQSTLHRYLEEIDAVKVSHGLWSYTPLDEEIELARLTVEKFG